MYTATESQISGVSFNLLHKGCGSRLKRRYICLREDVVVERSEMKVKGYEFERITVGSSSRRRTGMRWRRRAAIRSTSCRLLPAGAIDPIYFDNAYYLGPDKRGAKPYALLTEKRCAGPAPARWPDGCGKASNDMVQVRPGDDGLILQQLLYADEVRPMADLHVEKADVQPAELALAQRLIEQNSVGSYDPAAYADEEKARVLAAIDKKIAGKKITVTEQREATQGAEVADLMEALRASVQTAQTRSRENGRGCRIAPEGACKTTRRATRARAGARAARRGEASRQMTLYTLREVPGHARHPALGCRQADCGRRGHAKPRRHRRPLHLPGHGDAANRELLARGADPEPAASRARFRLRERQGRKRR
ncbi:Ku protein [Cupriavidus basilensis]